MKLKTLKGKIFDLNVTASRHPMKTEKSCKSNIQYLAGQKLRKKYPSDVILEEVHIPDGFYLDFFIPSRKIAVEVQGEQHSEFIPHFHKNKAGFVRSQDRDARKAEWCRINDIDLIYVDKDSI